VTKLEIDNTIKILIMIILFLEAIIMNN